jgi:hypothetical protein
MKNNRFFKLRLLIASLTTTACLVAAEARTSNGNEFALYFSEARTEGERQEIFLEARGRPHFFRYLQIMQIQKLTNEQGRVSINITAFEPSSCMDVIFNVVQPVSVSKILEAPESKLGDAIAVTGKIVEADRKKNMIRLDPVIVRHKDRLSPAAGKEMLYETDPNGTFYSFTDGPRPINVSYRDRDLLQHRHRILDEQGVQGWFEFLESELSRRREERSRSQSGDP